MEDVHKSQLIEAIKANNPKDVTIDVNEKSIVVTAPKYSSHSAVFDVAFRKAKELGYKYRGMGETPWKIKFSK